MATIAVSVRCATFTVGARNSGTPFETASTPVIAVHPLANARSSSHGPAAWTAGGSTGGAMTGAGWPPPANAFASPITITTPRLATNAYVGTMKATPASRTPRRLSNVSSVNTAREIDSVWGSNAGSADTSAPTPAEIPTATFRT
jgi:hypothetical protein